MIYKMLLIVKPNNQISNLDFLLKDYNTAKG